MASKKRKKGTRTEADTKGPAKEDPKSSADAKPVKWRWGVTLTALLTLSVLILFLSVIKFFDLLRVDRYAQDLLISYVGSTDTKPFDSRVALILVDKDPQPNPPFGAAHPTHRKHHADLIRGLTKAGAKVIVFDVLFRTNLAEVDANFAQAIQEAEKAGTNIVVGAFLEHGRYEPQIAAPIKAAVGNHWGIVDGALLDSGNTRFIRLAGPKGSEAFNGYDEQPVIPSIALQAVTLLNYPNQQTSTWFSPLTSEVRIRSGEGQGNLLTEVPVNRFMDLLIDLPAKADIPRYSYQEVLTNLNDYAGNFKDRIVVIGYQKDDVLPNTGSDPRYASEMHAAAISTLLGGNYMRPLPVLYHYLFILVLVAIAAFLQIRFSTWMSQTQTVPLPFLPAPINKITIPTPILVVSIVYILFAVLTFALGHIVFDMSYHLAALVMTYFLFVFGRSKLVRQ
jgi:CHASE2 domain-containing sensor protein